MLDARIYLITKITINRLTNVANKNNITISIEKSEFDPS